MWQYRGTSRLDTPAMFGLLVVFGAVFLFIFFTGAAAAPLASALAWPVTPRWFGTLYLWQPFTFQFVHVNFISFFVDALVLYFFGGSLERAWGGRRFLLFFLLSGIVTGAVGMALASMTGGVLFTGMVGSFVAIVVAFAAMNPYATVLFFFFPLQARWLAAIAIAFEIFANSMRYGGPIPALISVTAVSFFAWAFTRGNIGLPRGGGRGPGIKERMARWRQRRQWRRWQKEASRIQRPADLFKK